MYDEKSLQGIGNKIKLLRTLHKISQQELSQQLGVSQTHLCNIENGRVVVNLRLLMRAANLFKCKLDDIISGTFPNEEERAAEAAAGSYSSEEVRLLLKMLQVSSILKKWGCRLSGRIQHRSMNLLTILKSILMRSCI